MLYCFISVTQKFHLAKDTAKQPISGIFNFTAKV